jgi:hypothetical protein
MAFTTAPIIGGPERPPGNDLDNVAPLSLFSSLENFSACSAPRTLLVNRLRQ